MVTGENIKSKRHPGMNLEVVFVDNFTEECTCVELYSHDAKRIKVKFNDILEE